VCVCVSESVCVKERQTEQGRVLQCPTVCRVLQCDAEVCLVLHFLPCLAVSC